MLQWHLSPEIDADAQAVADAQGVAMRSYIGKWVENAHSRDMGCTAG